MRVYMKSIIGNMRRLMIWGTAMICLLLLEACGQREEFANTFKIYYVNNNETGILSEEYGTNSSETQALVEELLEKLGTIPEKLEYKAPLASGFSLLNYTISEGQIILNFDDHYKEQPVTTEILMRAALVKTLTQIKDINHVSILIRSDPLIDSVGNIVGVMTADMFIDNAGKEINTDEKIKLRLYFGDETGDKLIAVSRNEVYNSNVAIERLVVEKLIAGPVAGEEAYAAINPNTKMLGTTIKDGTCYVNLDSMFLTQLTNVDANVTIYSIVNSLVELPNVNKVQILVDGTTNVVFKESVNLATVFERNLDIVTGN